MSSTRSVGRRRPRPVFGHSTAVVPDSGSRRLMAVVFLVLVLGLCVIVGAGGALFWSLHHAQGSSSRTVRFHVGSGDTVTTVASRLQRAGLITNPLLFRLDAKLHGLGNNLKVGDYRLRPNMSIDQMTAALKVYHSATVQIVIPEGYRAEQIASILDHHGISGRQFLQAVRHPAVHYSILSDKPTQSGLEGYLFPNTYDVAPHSSGSQFAYLMVKTLDQKFTPAMRAQIARQRRSVYQVITLASIVEREAKVPSERPTIASVYMNRLHLHMILNADPTIQYAPSDVAIQHLYPCRSAAYSDLQSGSCQYPRSDQAGQHEFSVLCGQGKRASCVCPNVRAAAGKYREISAPVGTGVDDLHR
jgi:uncharacterized YceG family protein